MAYILYAGIYSITCTVNNKMYIGRSVQIPMRWKRHEYDFRDGIHTNKEMQSDYDKYGKESMVFEVLEEVPREIDSEEFDELEKRYISKYDTFNSGYNMTEGGFGHSGRTFSAATRRRMSEAHRGISRHTVESKAAIALAKGVKMAIDGEYKVGIGDTADELGITKHYLYKRLKDPNMPNYERLPKDMSEEEYYRQTKCRTTISEESRLQA